MSVKSITKTERLPHAQPASTEQSITLFLKAAAAIPEALSSRKEWKALPASAKEIYRTIERFYDYEEGISRVSQREIQNESGIGARTTIVKAIRSLEDANLIAIVVSITANKLKSYSYLMPYQEQFYAKMIGKPARDLSSVYQSSAPKMTIAPKNGIRIPDDVHPLFKKVWEKLDKLDVAQGHKLIAKYANDPENLRTIAFMCDATYVVERHNLPYLAQGKTAKERLVDAIKKGRIDETLYGVEETKEIRAIIKTRLTQEKKAL